MAFKSISDGFHKYNDLVSSGIKKTSAFSETLGGTLGNLTAGAKWSIVLTGISLIAGAVGWWYENEEKKIQQAQEAAKEYQNTTKSIETYREEVESLYKSIDSGDLSTEELYEARSRLNEIDKELKDQFGSGYASAFSGEYEGLTMLTAGAEEAAAAFERLAQAEAAAHYSENKSGIEKAINEYYSPGSYKVGTWDWVSMANDQKNQVEQIVSQFSNATLRIVEKFAEDGTKIGEEAYIEISGHAGEIQSTIAGLSIALSGVNLPYIGVLGGTADEIESESNRIARVVNN